MGEFALFDGVGLDEESDFVGCVLGLGCHAASEDDDVIVDVVDFIGDAIDGVDAAHGCT